MLAVRPAPLWLEELGGLRGADRRWRGTHCLAASRSPFSAEQRTIEMAAQRMNLVHRSATDCMKGLRHGTARD